MRFALALALAVSACFVAGSAAAGSNTMQCRTLTKQIAHFETVVDRARERDDELWEQGTLKHIDDLATRRARLCPKYARRDNAAKRFAQETGRLLKVAGKAAVRYFTFGAF